MGKVCCMADKKLMHHNSASETWTKSRLKNIRKDMLDNKSVADCLTCYKTEDLGGTSDRQYYINKYKNIQDTLNFNVTTGNIYEKPVDLDLRLSNLCNLGCRMCGPHYSSTLEKDLRKLPELEDLQGFTGTDSNNGLSDVDINYLITENPNIRRIKFLGGEPTLMPEVYKILDILIEKQRQPQIGITTNCTNLNKKFLKYLQYFKNTTINMSIDGTGNTLEYIRHPVKYKIVKEHSRVMASLATSTNINIVIQALNLHNLSEFIDFVMDVSSYSKTTVDRINSVIATYPNGVSPYYMPVGYRKQCIEKALNNKNINHEMFGYTFKKELEKIYNSDKVLPIQEFLFRNMLFDQLRNTHMYNIMPDAREYIKESINDIDKFGNHKGRLIAHYIDREIVNLLRG